MRSVTRKISLSIWLGAAFGVASCSSLPTTAVAFDWRSDWVIEEGYNIQPDTAGYQFPTAMAFVPNPGNDSKDPLYFVVEIAGRVKVVTNDKSVLTFAEGFSHLRRDLELPDEDAEVGAAGICLEPKRGYVFVTFIDQDENGIFRNRIIRFETAPQKFSIQPRGQVLLTEAFEKDRLARSGHQIGPCQIENDLLYVGIGDALRGAQSQSLDTLVGKIARMTLDGLPAPGNPFRVNEDPRTPRNYVWALGLRNPFGLKIVESQVFVSDNGNDVDRFMRVTSGHNYLWDGSDWSIGTNADAVIAPSIAPAQMDYYPARGLFFPIPQRNQFFLAGASNESGKKTGILALPYNFTDRAMQSPPRYFLRYRGAGEQSLAALAFGADGLYFAPLLPDRNGATMILRVAYDPARAHPYTLNDATNLSELLVGKGCFGCHALNGSKGSEGPQLDANMLVPRLAARLNTDAYRERVRALDQLDQEPYRIYRTARQKILDAQGTNQERLWLAAFLQEPTFDNPNSRMPNLGLSQTQAEVIADYLLKGEENPILSAWYRVVPVLQDHLLIFAGTSFLVGGICFELMRWFWKRRRNGA